MPPASPDLADDFPAGEPARDPIVEQVRKQRQATEESCGRDWRRLVEHYRKVQASIPRLTRRGPKRWSAASDNRP